MCILFSRHTRLSTSNMLSPSVNSTAVGASRTPSAGIRSAFSALSRSRFSRIAAQEMETVHVGTVLSGDASGLLEELSCESELPPVGNASEAFPSGTPLSTGCCSPTGGAAGVSASCRSVSEGADVAGASCAASGAGVSLCAGVGVGVGSVVCALQPARVNISASASSAAQRRFAVFMSVSLLSFRCCYAIRRQAASAPPSGRSCSRRARRGRATRGRRLPARLP